MRPRLPLRAAGAVSACLVLSGCLTPAPDDTVYRAKAAAAVSSGVSEVRTASLTVQARLDGSAPGPYSDVVVTDAENALGPIQAAFAAVQPPRTSTADDVRSHVLDALGSAEESLARTRISLRRNDRPALIDLLPELESSARELESLEDELG